MLWGLTAEGLADYNRIVGFPHRLRPFEAERVLLAVPTDPLLAGLTLRDVVMDNGEKMFPWMSLMRPDGDAFTGIVDYTDIAPFGEYPGTKAGDLAAAVSAGAGWSRNVVNGFTKADAWKLIHYMQSANPRLTVTLPGSEEVRRFSINLNCDYAKPAVVNLYFDDDRTPVPLAVQRAPERQDFELTPRKASKLTIELADFDKVHEVCGIDNIWIEVARPEAFLKRARPLLNIGALMRYDVGTGGIVLNQLKSLEREKNPVNTTKKSAILRALLANLGAIMGGERPLVAGGMLRYEPVAAPAGSYNAFVSRTGQPAWFPGPGDLSALPVGEQTYSGVRFLLGDFKTSPVPSVWMLQGKGSGVKVDEVGGIAVGRKADALFFLHTLHPQPPIAAWERDAANKIARKQAPPEPPVCFTYEVAYEDGTNASIPVRWGQDIGSWMAKDLRPLPNAGIAWSGALGDAKSEQAAVWTMQWNNPKPAVAIRSLAIKAVEGGKHGIPAVFAITTAQRVE
jgi:beta-galactosidase